VPENALIHKARATVEALLKAAKPEWVTYHNFEHAKAVVRASEKTIKVHRARVMEKMGAQSLADLVRFAEKLGIRSSSD